MIKRKRRFEWDRLRTLGSSRLVQMTVVIPVIGYLILFSSNLAEYFVLKVDGSVTEPVFWRLYMLYFGFCLLAVASGIFSWRCPETIKFHGAGFEFLEKEGDGISKHRIDEIKDALAEAYFKATYPTSRFSAFGILREDGSDNREINIMQSQVKQWLDNLNVMPRKDLLLEYFVALKQSDKKVACCRTPVIRRWFCHLGVSNTARFRVRRPCIWSPGIWRGQLDFH